ncbi:MAG: ATP-binding domain-containing protein [Bacilli bacterium]
MNLDHPHVLLGLDFAFALTIHAAQGDQFEDVIVCIGAVKHQDHTRAVSSRNNLYIAVSRARRSVRLYDQSGVSLPEALAWNAEVCVGELASAWRQDGRRQGR